MINKLQTNIEIIFETKIALINCNNINLYLY